MTHKIWVILYVSYCMSHTTLYCRNNRRNHITLFQPGQIKSGRSEGVRMDVLELNCTVILIKVDAEGQKWTRSKLKLKTIVWPNSLWPSTLIFQDRLRSQTVQFQSLKLRPSRLINLKFCRTWFRKLCKSLESDCIWS